MMAVTFLISDGSTTTHTHQNYTHSLIYSSENLVLWVKTKRSSVVGIQSTTLNLNRTLIIVGRSLDAYLYEFYQIRCDGDGS